MICVSDLPRYTRVAIVLHWSIALMIGFNLLFGWFMEGFPPPLKMVVLPLHISCGFTILALTSIRVVWRLLHAPPPLVGVSALEQGAAHIAHFLLYAGMVLMPLTGWAILSAHPASDSQGYRVEQAAMAARIARMIPPGGHATTRKPPSFKPGIAAWWIVPVPSIAVVQAVGETSEGLSIQKHMHDAFVNWHEMGGWMMVALLTLHVMGALKHQWMDRRPFLQRMSWPRP